MFPRTNTNANTMPTEGQVADGKYYYVPSLFIDGEKLFEAQPGQDYETIKAAVEKTLKAAAE